MGKILVKFRVIHQSEKVETMANVKSSLFCHFGEELSPADCSRRIA